MRIYYSCSITGGRAEEATYQAIVRELESEGHEVPTAHLSSPNVMEMEKIVNAVDIFTRDMAWLRECDAVVAEVSSPSHGVGYEIAYGLSLGKPVFCCYRKDRRVSKIITGNTTPGIKVLSYETDAEAVNLVRNYLLSLEKSE